MIAPRQPMNSCRPPSSRISSGPGWMNRWKVLPSTSSHPSAATSAACSDFTVAVEASGTNAGVCTSPCGVWITPARAAPSRASMVNGRAVRAGARLRGPEMSRGRLEAAPLSDGS